MLPPHALTAALAGATAVVLAVGGYVGVTAAGTPSSGASGTTTPTTAGAQWVAAPQGSGTACTSDRPCTPEAALAQAGPGDVVTLEQGEYPLVRTTRTARPATAAEPVLLRAAEGAEVTLAGLTAVAPGVAVEGVRVTGTVYVKPSAVGTDLRRLHVSGAGVFLRADGSRLVDSLVEGGDSVDGVQIKDGRGILVQGNTVRGFAQLTGSLHADCIQVFDASDVTIRANTIHDCDNAGLIFSGGAGRGISDVLVEANFVTGCRVRTEACTGGTAIDLREPRAVDVVVRNNTFAGGSVRIAALPGLVVDRNVFGYLSSCATPMTNSVVRSWNTGLCREPALLGRDGNRLGDPAFVDRDAVDLHAADPAGVRVDPVDTAQRAGLPPARDIDGQAFSPTTAGADEPGGGPVAPVPGPVTPLQPAAPELAVELAPEAGVRSGTTTVTATVTGGAASSVVFAAAGRTFARGSTADGGLTWTASVDSRRLRDGTYAVTAVATDAAGRSVASAPVSARVDN